MKSADERVAVAAGQQLRGPLPLGPAVEPSGHRAGLAFEPPPLPRQFLTTKRRR